MSIPGERGQEPGEVGDHRCDGLASTKVKTTLTYTITCNVCGRYEFEHADDYTDGPIDPL